MNALKRSCLLLAAVAAPAFASGFALDTSDAASVGMGGAVTGLIDSPASNYYNPAGLAWQGKGVAASVGVALIFPQISYTDGAGTSTTSQSSVATPINAYIQAGLTDEIALGIGFYTPFGAGLTWPENWEGQFRAQSSSLQTFDINPNIAFKVHPRLSIAGGINIVRGTVAIERHLDFVDSVGAVNLGGGAWGVGWNLAMKAEIVPEHVFFGASFRGGTKLDFSGRAHFENVPAEFSGNIYDQSIKASVTLPMNANFGFGFKVTPKLKFGLDVTWYNWSSFTDLTIAFENPDLTNPLQKKWYDTASVAIGGEYEVGAGVKVRLGFVYDPTPTPAKTLTPDLPDATRLHIAAGVGWAHSSGFSADLGFQFIALVKPGKQRSRLQRHLWRQRRSDRR